MALFRPTLACHETPDFNQISYPKFGSPKFDGIRALVKPCGLMTRRMKLVPNLALQRILSHPRMMDFDGELVAGDPTEPLCFHRTQSIVMSENKPIRDITFYVFDWCGRPALRYADRLSELRLRLAAAQKLSTFPRNVKLVEQVLVHTPQQALDMEETLVGLGWEGAMFRDPQSPYKYGRSTMREEYLLKCKRFESFEAVILETYEQQTNTNMATMNEVGYSKRSSAKAGKRPAGTLGRFKVRHLKTKVEFFVGAGPALTKKSRKELWDVRETLPGRIIHGRYQLVGTKDKPRSPRMYGFRDRRDL